MKAVRQTITVNVPAAVAERFREAVDAFDGRMGLCISAGMLLFLQAGRAKQEQMVQQLFTASMNEAELLKLIDSGLTGKDSESE